MEPTSSQKPAAPEAKPLEATVTATSPAEKVELADTAPGDDWAAFRSKPAEPASEQKQEAATEQPVVLKKEEAEPKKQESFLLGKRKKEPKSESSMDKALPGEDLADKPVLHHAVFRSFAFFTPLSLFILLLFCSWTAFIVGNISCPAELANYKVYGALAASPLLPSAAGLTSMPLFFWLAKAVSWIPFLPEGAVQPIASFLGGFCLLLGVWIAACSASLGRFTAMAAGLVLLCTPFFLACTNFFGPVALATGLCVASIGLIGKAWTKEFSISRMVIGNIFAALAGLTGGLFYALVPVVSSFLLCFWRMDFRHRRTDALVGFFSFLLVFVLWAAIIILVTQSIGAASFDTILFTFSKFTVWKWSNPIILWAVALFPFLLVFFCASWGRILKNSIADLRASRHESASGIFWIALFVALGLSLFAPNFADFMPAVAISAILIGRALLRLNKTGIKFFFLLQGILFLAVSLVTLFLVNPTIKGFLLPYLPFTLPQHPIFSSLAGLDSTLGYVLFALPLLAALAIPHVAWRSNTAAAPLLMTTLMVILMATPIGYFVAPQLAKIPELKLSMDAPCLDFAKLSSAIKSFTKKSEAPVAPAAEAEKPAAPAAPAAATEKPAAPAAPAAAAEKPADPATPAAEAKKPAAPAAAAEKPAAPAAPAAETEKPAAPAK